MPNRDSLTWIAHEARTLRDRGALQGKSWSLAQVCEHLALAVQRTAEPPDRDPNATVPANWWPNLGPTQRLKRRIMKRALLTFGRFPEGVPAPKFVQPSPAADLDTALRALDDAAAAFDRKHAQPDAKWNDHPLFGPMTGADWRRFHDVHAAHHFRILNKRCS